MLTLTLLGYPTLVRDTAPVTDFISQKALALASYVAVEKRAHSREALATLFWGDSTTDRALSNLRQALHNIQKLLPDFLMVSRLSVQVNPDFALHVDVDSIDNNRPLSDAEVMALHRGDFFEGVYFDDAEPLESWVRTRQEHYRIAYGHLLERHIDAAFARRDWPTLEQLVARAITHDPLDERPYRMLWRVLTRRGDISNAISSAQSLRDILTRELGVNPSPPSELLERRLRLAQHATLHNLPPVSTPFIGRSTELEQISVWLHQPEHRLITITGVGGAGKSRLAQEAAVFNARSFINGVRFVALAALPANVYLPSALAEALEVPLQNKANPLQAIQEHLAEREVLLLLDNAEHLDGVSALVTQILAAAPDCRILVTSRQRLGLREEWVLALEGLPVSHADSPAVRLLAQAASQQGYSVNTQDEAVQRICALLEGLPLGLELVAALLSQQSAATLVDQLATNLDALQSSWHNAEPRHFSLRAVFDTSWRSLNAEKQQALARVSIFNAPFTAHAAQAICHIDHSMLNALAARSLVRQTSERYSTHAVIRRYALEALDDVSAVMEHYTAYYLSQLSQAEVLFTARDIPAGVAAMTAEIDHIRQVWQYGIDTRQLALIERMTFTMHRFYEGSGLYAEGQAFFRSSRDALALDAMIARERTLSGRLCAHEAGTLLRLGRVPDALTAAEEATDLLAAQEDHPEMLAFALNTLGIARLYSGATDQAVMALEQCADIYRRLGMMELLKPLVNLGSVYTRTGDLDRAYAAMLEADGLAQQMGDKMGAFHIKNGLGTICAMRQQFTDALPHLIEAQSLAQQLGFLQGHAMSLNNQADVHLQLDQPQQAQELSQQALAIAQQINDHRAATYALVTLALAQIQLKSDSARSTLAQALRQAQAAGSEPLLTMVLYAGGEWYQQQGDTLHAQQILHTVAQHPATEADYRRRAQARLRGGRGEITDLQTLSTLMSKDIGVK